MANNLIKDRPMSGFPVSMGTGLSLETIFTPVQDVVDSERKFEKLTDPSAYDLYMVNTSTIARNLMSNFRFEELFDINRKELVKTFNEELDFIKMHFLYWKLPLVMYYNNYRRVNNTYKSTDRLRLLRTDKQFKVHEFMEMCMKSLDKRDDIVKVDSRLPPSRKDRALVLTHVPYDLLSYGSFRQLDLLESNSGAIKPRKLWWTKYHKVPGEDMSFLPFMEYLLSIFGDSVMFKPAPRKERDNLITQLKARGVHPMMKEFSLDFISK